MSQPPTQPHSSHRRILTKAEAAELLGISERTLSRRHAEGMGPPCIKHGRKVAYFEDSVLNWLASLERKGVRLA